MKRLSHIDMYINRIKYIQIIITLKFAKDGPAVVVVISSKNVIV